jgi:diguanylate cyclase (GGDEF)-like protein/PAS domain S-box-containing protein
VSVPKPLTTDTSLAGFLDESPVAILVARADGVVLGVNAAFRKTMGRDALEGTPIDAIIHPDDRAQAQHERETMVSASSFERQFLRKDGASLFAVGAVSCQRDGTLIYQFLDVSRLKDQERRLSEEKEQLSNTLRSVADAVMCTDINARVSFLNPAAEQLTGWSIHEAIGRQAAEVFAIVEEETGKTPHDLIGQCLRNGQSFTRERGIFLLSRTGNAYDIGLSIAPVRAGDTTISGAVILFNDVTEVRESEKKIAHSARRDALTGLPNRTTFISKLQEALNQAREEGREHVLCFIDLDRFKNVNDSSGHAAGDALLRDVAKIIALACSGKDVPARLGGDEFALLIGDATIAEAAHTVEGIIAAIAALEFRWEGRIHRIGGSAGATPVKRDSPEINELLHQADKACYAAKESGRNRLCVYARGSADTALPDSEQRPRPTLFH